MIINESLRSTLLTNIMQAYTAKYEPKDIINEIHSELACYAIETIKAKYATAYKAIEEGLLPPEVFRWASSIDVLKPDGKTLWVNVGVYHKDSKVIAKSLEPIIDMSKPVCTDPNNTAYSELTKKYNELLPRMQTYAEEYSAYAKGRAEYKKSIEVILNHTATTEELQKLLPELTPYIPNYAKGNETNMCINIDITKLLDSVRNTL